MADGQLSDNEFKVSADHAAESHMSTAAMQPMKTPKQTTAVQHPKLIIWESQTIELTQSLVNIGRDDANHITIKDAYISRHHLQLRRRFGAYSLFDVNSRGGTQVNDTVVREHRLQNGDVIQIGHTKIIYTDETNSSSNAESTQTLDPV